MPYPKWNTTPIKCGNRKCKWTGLEGDLKAVPDPEPNPLGVSQNVCPECGCQSYTYITKQHDIGLLPKRSERDICDFNL